MLSALPLLFLSSVAANTLAEVSPVGLCDSVKQYSGYYKLSTGNKNYFYWAFESRSDPVNDPVLLWMTGGPGCSSAVALFGENGPCTIDAAGNKTTPNPYSWNQHATVIYIDQPAGTGFSFGTPDATEKGVAADMYSFLQDFFKGHPSFQKNAFFAFGESFAGHYVPAVTHMIYEMNKALPAGDVHINLQGVAIGNGLTDPLTQFNYYADMAVSTNDHKPAVSNLTHDLMKAATPLCIDAIKACQSLPETCVLAIDTCNIGLLLPYQASGMNPYDMREKCQVPPLCYDFSNVQTFLSKPDVQAQLGIDPKHTHWEDCNRGIALLFELSGDWMQSFQTKIPEQLASGIRVLIYAGDQDFICNHLGNHAWTQAMSWPHQKDFNATALAPWSVGGKEAGLKQSSHNFTFLRVYDAGHMVPRDQPEAALAMVNAFLTDKL